MPFSCASSRRIAGNLELLPHPVSPCMMVTLSVLIRSNISVRWLSIGNFSFPSLIRLPLESRLPVPFSVLVDLGGY